MKITKRKLCRLQEGLSQDEAAKELGISQSYLSLIELNRVPVDQEFLQCMAKLYNCNLQDVI
ncbi:MAG TPA: helix-turn-helix transcriptional regulator [Selenomonadales bacterium]|nr:helix-turn-helix transcriptional regulator [Selenomonadales bacterium]